MTVYGVDVVPFLGLIFSATVICPVWPRPSATPYCTAPDVGEPEEGTGACGPELNSPMPVESLALFGTGPKKFHCTVFPSPRQG